MNRFRLFAGALACLCLGLIGWHFADAAITQSELRVKFTATETTTAIAGVNPAFSPSIEKLIDFTSGTTANKYDVLYVGSRTIAASSSENLDLTGTALKNAFQGNIANAKMVGVIVIADTANTNDVLVGGAASNGWFGMFSDATDVAVVKPGGVFLNIAPDANGLGAVTAGTGDLLKVANSSSGTSVTYTVILLGRSA